MIGVANLVFLFSTPLSIIYTALGIVKRPKNWRKYFPFYTAAMFMLAYSFEPIIQNDLTRYFEQCRQFSEMSLLRVFDLENDGLFVKNTIFWLVGKYGDLHILPALSNTVVYGVTYFITCSSAEEYGQIDLIPKILLFQILTLPFNGITSNVRNICAFSLIILAAYLDIVKKRRNIGVILLYILPCLIHLSAAVIVLLRIIAEVINKFKIISISILFIAPIAINVSYQNTALLRRLGSVGYYFSLIVEKAFDYSDTVHMSAYERGVVASRFWTVYRLLSILMAIVFIIMIYFNSGKINDQMDKYNTFVLLICILTISCSSFSAPAFWRFISAVLITSSSFLIPALSSAWNNKPVKLVNLLLPFFVMLRLMLEIYSARGTMEFTNYLVNVLMDNVYYVLVRGILNCI